MMPDAPRVPPEHWEEIGQLYLALCDRLREAAEHQLGPDGRLAADIVQEAFHDAALFWDGLRQRAPGAREAWLRTVIRNKIYDHWRTDGRRLIPLHDAASAVPEASHQDTAIQALHRIDVHECLKVIGAMPEAQRRVAFLRWQGRWTTREIAGHLGIAESTVRVHLRNARLDLHTLRTGADRDDNPEEGRPR